MCADSFIFFLHENISRGYSLEVPHRGSALLMTTHNIMFLWQNKKKCIFSNGMGRNIDPDQPASSGAGCSRSGLFPYAILSEKLVYEILGQCDQM